MYNLASITFKNIDIAGVGQQAPIRARHRRHTISNQVAIWTNRNGSSLLILLISQWSPQREWAVLLINVPNRDRTVRVRHRQELLLSIDRDTPHGSRKRRINAKPRDALIRDILRVHRIRKINTKN